MNSPRTIFAYLVFLSVLLTSSGQAAEPVGIEGPSPVKIEANHMISDQKNNSVFFSGRVDATQGDVVIHADEMTVFYLKNRSNHDNSNTNSSKNIQRLRAVGNVEITKDKWVATGDTAEYLESERKVVLIGNTKVWQDNNLVTGDKFTIYLDEEKSVVESNSDASERVKAFFYPNSDKKEQ